MGLAEGAPLAAITPNLTIDHHIPVEVAIVGDSLATSDSRAVLGRVVEGLGRWGPLRGHHRWPLLIPFHLGF
ncbi:hypothetical protein CRG98_011651 [Punica granatum]|uniref:Uncharacterized protein n=1 Tax=Punica granatum TaxID=22663 RepID=A0A2I0KHQ9_PUNGR|nr:hypothetical protein CRG98_011651 [Punica granatum]